MVASGPLGRGNSVGGPMSGISVAAVSALEAAHSSSGGGKGFLKTGALLLVLGGAGYVGWQNVQPLQYLHGSSAAQNVKQPATSAEVTALAPGAHSPGVRENTE